MRIQFEFKKTGTDNKYICNMETVPPLGAKVFVHTLRYVESYPRIVEDVYWFAKPDDDTQVDVKVILS